MKALLILLTIIAGITFESRSETLKNGEHKSATSTSLSHEQELELLKDYFPEKEDRADMLQITVQIYDSNLELVMEGKINPDEDNQNEELKRYLRDSDFLMNINGKSLYMLEN